MTQSQEIEADLAALTKYNPNVARIQKLTAQLLSSGHKMTPDAAEGLNVARASSESEPAKQSESPKPKDAVWKASSSPTVTEIAIGCSHWKDAFLFLVFFSLWQVAHV